MEFLQLDKQPRARFIEEIVEDFKNGKIADGQDICIKGTLHRIKDMSGFAFVNVRSYKLVCQCIWEEGTSTCDLSKFSVEEAVIIDGFVRVEERSRLGFDVVIKDMERISGEVKETLPVEISNNRKIDKLNLNTMLDNRVLTIRNPKVRSILRVADTIMNGFVEFMRSQNFTLFVAPKIVEAGAEGGADMFEVDYFGEMAYLSQSPQMYKQYMVGSVIRSCTLCPVFRAEKFSTNRHINEFQGMDFEMGFIESFEDVMVMEAKLFQHIFKKLNEENAEDLELFLGKDARLPELKEFPKIKFQDAKKLYADAHKGEVGEQALLEPDLSPDEENWLGEYFNKEYGSPFVFVTHYPTAKRPFYTMEDPEDRTYTLSFDLLLNGLEITTGGQRIHDYDMLVEKMEKRGMNKDDFADYLSMFKYGMPPHGGLGLGLERIVQNILGLQNIKLATAFPRDRERLRP